MSRRITERDLRHDADSVRFGDAMARCEGFAPWCSEYGRCQMEGSCFSGAANLIAARMIERMVGRSGHAIGAHWAYLKRAAEMLREGRVHL